MQSYRTVCNGVQWCQHSAVSCQAGTNDIRLLLIRFLLFDRDAILYIQSSFSTEVLVLTVVSSIVVIPKYCI